MQIVISGLLFGCVYGLIALGLVLITRTTGVVNFAHGEMAMVTAFVGYTFIVRAGFPIPLAFLAALLFAAILGALTYVALLRFVNQADHLAQLVLTLGLFMLLHGVAGLIWGYEPAGFPKIFSGQPWGIGPVFVSPNEILILLITLVLSLVLFLLFRFTRAGLAMRASAQDLTAARLMGIQVDQIYMLTWCAGGVLGGAAGVLAAPYTFLSVSMMLDPLIMAFAAAVLAGFASLPGTVLGGALIGVFINLVRFYWAPEMAELATFLLIVIILYVRPQGLFGGPQTVKKV